MKFLRQNNYTGKAKMLYFLNLVYVLSLVGLWQNHVIYLPLTGYMWRNTMPFGNKVVNKYGSVCHYYRYFFFKHEKKNQSLSNDWPTYCHTGIPNKQQILSIMSSWMNIRFALYDYIDNCRLLNVACIGLLPSDGEVSLIYFQRKTFYFEH